MNLFFRKILVLILSVFFFSAIENSGDGNVCVTLKAGNVQYQRSPNDPWQQLSPNKPRICLDEKSRIKLSQNTEVSITGKGKSAPFRTAGIWQLLPLISKESNPPSIFDRTMDFLLAKAKKSPFSLDEYAKVNMRQKGVVSRDGECIPIMTSPLYGTNLIGTVVKFSWNPTDKNSEYNFSIYESASQIAQPIYTLDTTGTNVEIDLADLDVVPGQDYYWSATKKGAEKCITYTFRIAEKEVNDKLAAALQELDKELPENPGLHAAVSAALYEESNFLENAKNQYEKAMQTEPKNALFKDSYGLFLARNGQVKAAEKILK